MGKITREWRMMREIRKQTAQRGGKADNVRQLMRSHTMSRTSLRLRATLHNIHAIVCDEEAGHVFLPQRWHKYDDVCCPIAGQSWSRPRFTSLTPRERHHDIGQPGSNDGVGMDNRARLMEKLHLY